SQQPIYEKSGDSRQVARSLQAGCFGHIYKALTEDWQPHGKKSNYKNQQGGFFESNTSPYCNLQANCRIIFVQFLLAGYKACCLLNTEIGGIGGKLPSTLMLCTLP
ncbi:MAG: hypothetical protein JAY96_13205, partial [Candidatus Thiodiazotropha endolucinida]|nr:hypothetical protein [Candidatus Thiodiazotropha taylori]MCW4249146.1 hypothetical protein [Candidatus Thiodiazotropha endolucinida]